MGGDLVTDMEKRVAAKRKKPVANSSHQREERVVIYQRGSISPQREIVLPYTQEPDPTLKMTSEELLALSSFDAFIYSQFTVEDNYYLAGGHQEKGVL